MAHKLSKVEIILLVVGIAAVLGAVGVVVWFLKFRTPPAPKATMNFVNGAWQGTFTLNFPSSWGAGAYNILDTSQSGAPVISPGYTAATGPQTWAGYCGDSNTPCPSTVIPQVKDLVTVEGSYNCSGVRIPPSFSVINFTGTDVSSGCISFS